MPNKSGIEWIRNDDGTPGLTVNPVIGCSRVSPGCGGGYIRGPNGGQGGCWAEHLVSTRMSKNSKLPMYADLARPGGGWSGKVKLVPDRLKEIVALGRRKTRARVFVCDMSDIFHDDVPFEFIAAVWGAMACAPQSLFYVLTKRPKRALEWAGWLAHEAPIDADMGWSYWRSLFRHLDDEALPRRCPRAPIPLNAAWPLPNVAFGVTVEDSRFGVPRLELGRQFPARWHFASVEPLLEDLGSDVDFRGCDLVIEGGEAGPGFPGDPMLRGTRGAWVVALGKKGNDLTRLPADLQIRENLPMPGAK